MGGTTMQEQKQQQEHPQRFPEIRFRGANVNFLRAARRNRQSLSRRPITARR